MGRSVPSGTPERPTRYSLPRRRGRLVAASLVLPLVMLAAVFGFYQVGYPEVASPAPVALMHAPIGGACQECHGSAYPYEVVDLRCERCHDPRVTGRYQPDAHAEWIPPSRQLASSSASFTCASCHTEHRGRLAELQLADTSDCASCHGFTTLDAHPEFAAAAGREGTGTRGLRFSHPRHIDEVRRRLGRGCETCHRSTRDLSGFEPVSFESQCAFCHLKDGVLPAMTDPVGEMLVTSPAGLPGAGDGYAIRRPGRGRIVVSGLVHRDPWILDNVRRLNRGFDADADREERAALEARIAALERARTLALPDAAISDLRERLSTFRGGTPPGAGGSGTAKLDPRTRRLFDRVTLEIERRESGGAAPVSLAATLAEERAIESALAAARARLTLVADRLNAPAVAPDVRAQRAEAILSLTGSCLTCHVLQDERDLAPVTTSTRRLPRARFTHAPHVSQVTCETCHQTTEATPGTTGLSTPRIETCRQCHATGQAPFGCAVCHTYHPAPEAGFGRRASAGR